MDCRRGSRKDLVPRRIQDERSPCFRSLVRCNVGSFMLVQV